MTAVKSSHFILVLAVFLAALLGCASGCLLAIQYIHRPVPMHGHDWLHNQLNLSATQRLQLENIEDRFEELESTLDRDLLNANKRLGQIIEDERQFTPTVSAAIENVHRAMAELQKATIEHLFEMEHVLTPEQYKLLLKLAAEALSQ